MKMNGLITQWLYKIDKVANEKSPLIIDGKYKPHLNDALARFIMISYSQDKSGEIFERKTPYLELDISFISNDERHQKTTGLIYSEEYDVNIKTEIVTVDYIVKQFNISLLDKNNEVDRMFRHLPKLNKPGLSLLDLTKAIQQDLNGVFLR